jgi:hypothetical protein
MAKQTISYFAARPDIVKIFDDLEAYREYCVFEMVEFNEAALYNRNDKNWQHYEASKRPRREWKPRGEYNRSGASRSGQARNFTR